MTQHVDLPNSPRPRRWRRMVRRALIILALVYLGFCAVLYSSQTQIIFPGAAFQGTDWAVVHPSPGTELVTLKTREGVRVVGLFGPALNADGSPRPDAPRCPTILYFYGNGMCLRAAESQFDTFRRLGANVMVAEYVGYGMSGGTPSQAGCFATADAAYEHLRARPDVDSSRLVILGWSLGGGVAIDLASRREVAGLAVFSTFTSLVDMAKQAYPWIPVGWLLRHRFDNLAKIPKVTCPILIGHGGRDSLVPPAMSERLEAAAKAPVRRFVIEEAGHNNMFDADPDRIRAELLRFLDGVR